MVKDFLKNEDGQSVVEYSLLMALIGASLVFALTLFGISISQTMGISDMNVQRYTEWANERFRSK